MLENFHPQVIMHGVLLGLLLIGAFGLMLQSEKDE